MMELESQADGIFRVKEQPFTAHVYLAHVLGNLLDSYSTNGFQSCITTQCSGSHRFLSIPSNDEQDSTTQPACYIVRLQRTARKRSSVSHKLETRALTLFKVRIEVWVVSTSTLDGHVTRQTRH